jgi:hypothetical protein
MVIASGNLMNSALGQETIIRAELLFDGKVINTVNCSPPCGAATLVGIKESVKPGRHTVAFRVAVQSSSPNTYETVGATIETLESRFELGGVTRVLATGESISYTVDLSR